MSIRVFARNDQEGASTYALKLVQAGEESMRKAYHNTKGQGRFSAQVSNRIQGIVWNSFPKDYLKSQHVIDGRRFEAQRYSKHVR